MEKNMNHWRPEPFFVGDCMPFYRDGVFHLYYLLDEGHHNHSLVGSLGGHQWAHVVSENLREWRQEPIALSLDFANGECSNCTGSVLDWHGKTYAFYALRSRRFTGEQFRIATSEDGGKTFQKWDAPELKTPPPGYTANFRDPMAFIGEDGLVHVLISTALLEEKNGLEVPVGEVAHYTTSDLIRYKMESPLRHSWHVPECCDYFRWGEYYYYSWCLAWESHYCYSQKPFSAWILPESDVPASKYCCVMKTAPWKDGRRIGVGWVPSWEKGVMLFGGRTVFREIIQNGDGTLGTAFVNEMLPNRNETALPSVSLEEKSGMSWSGLGIFSDEFRLDGEISFSAGIRDFGFVIMDSGKEWKRYVTFCPRARTVELDSFARINQVDMSRGKISFRLLRTKDVLDLEIDGRRTVVSSLVDFPGSITAFYVTEGKCEVNNLKVFDR